MESMTFKMSNMSTMNIRNPHTKISFSSIVQSKLRNKNKLKIRLEDYKGILLYQMHIKYSICSEFANFSLFLCRLIS